MPEARTNARRPRLLHLGGGVVAAGVLLAFLSRGDHPASDRGSAAPSAADSAVVRGGGDGSPTQAEADANAAALAAVLAGATVKDTAGNVVDMEAFTSAGDDAEDADADAQSAEAADEAPAEAAEEN